MSLPVVCFDLDSTLRDSRQRWHLSPRHDPSRTWHEYTTAGTDDPPVPGTVALLKMLFHGGHQIHIVSGSNESARPETEWWLSAHVGLDLIERISLYQVGRDTRPNAAYKADYVLDLQAQGRIVDLFVEDWLPGARYIYETTGVPVLSPNPGYPCEQCGLDPYEAAMAGMTDNIGGGL